MLWQNRASMGKASATRAHENVNATRKRYFVSRLLPVLAVAIIVIVAAIRIHRSRNSHIVADSDAMQLPQAKPAGDAKFLPTIANTAPAPSPGPAGMVWIPGGEFSMGANDPPDMDEVGMKATEDARPIHRVYVDSFFMDKTDVTNAEFAKFVKATGYVTIARKPGRRIGRVHPARSSRTARQSLAMVELRAGSELAASVWAR